MRSEVKRADRVAEMIQRKLSQIIQLEIKDPRVPQFVTISAVNVSPDLGHAKVYFTILNGDIGLTASILNAASSYLRTALARTIKLRIVPQLFFVYDQSIEYGKHLSRLIDDANQPKSDNEEEG